MNMSWAEGSSRSSFGEIIWTASGKGGKENESSLIPGSKPATGLGAPCFRTGKNEFSYSLKKYLKDDA